MLNDLPKIIQPTNVRQRLVLAGLPFPDREQVGMIEAIDLLFCFGTFVFIQVPPRMLANKRVKTYFNNNNKKDHVPKLCDLNSKAGDFSPFLISIHFHLDLDFQFLSHSTQVCTNAPCIWAGRITPVISIS